jgi:hypothetical protein
MEEDWQAEILSDKTRAYGLAVKLNQASIRLGREE